MKNQKGFVVPLVIAIVALLAIGGGTYVYVKNNKEKKVDKTEKTEKTENQDQTSDWKTYKNEEYGFEFKYPEDYELTEQTSPSVTNYESRAEIRVENTHKNEAFFVSINPYDHGFCEGYNSSTKEIPIANTIVNCSVCEYDNSSITTFCPLVKLNKNNYEIYFRYQNNNTLTVNQIISTLKFITPTQGQTEQNKETDKVACTMDAKMCPDGSFVGRSGPNCEFTDCPIENSDNYEWKTFTNNEGLGFFLKYPSFFEVNNGKNGKVTFDDKYPVGMKISFEIMGAKNNNTSGDDTTRAVWSTSPWSPGVETSMKKIKIAGYDAIVISRSDISPYGELGYIHPGGDKMIIYRVYFSDGSKYPIEDQVKIYEKMLESLKFFAL